MKDNWLNSKYPLTITKDRYGGNYSSGNYIAWPLDFNEIPHYSNSSDVSCRVFWDIYDKPVGKGRSVVEAYQNLVEQYDKSDKKTEVLASIKDLIGDGLDYANWMQLPNYTLDGKSPNELLEENKFEELETMVGRINHGVYF